MRRIVPTADWVRCSDDGAACLKRGNDTGLGYRDGLLFHSFVYRRPICIVHLVKLVDQAMTLVGEHERTTLERPFARDRVLAHARRQAYLN